MGRVPGVYILKFKSGRLYVGGSLNLDRRVDQHMKNLRRGSHPQMALQREFNSCGGVLSVEKKMVPVEDAFELQVIERVTIRMMIQRYGRQRVLNDELSPGAIGIRHPEVEEVEPIFPYE